MNQTSMETLSVKVVCTVQYGMPARPQHFSQNTKSGTVHGTQICQSLQIWMIWQSLWWAFSCFILSKFHDSTSSVGPLISITLDY